jgi:NADH-quinone oxidoreductase subunit C
MTSTTSTSEILRDAIARSLGEGAPIAWRRDAKGVWTGWCRLAGVEFLTEAARAVAALEGRLSMVTAQLSPAAQGAGVREISYHFDLDGSTLTLAVELPLEGARVPSLTPIFRNADWNEREFRELYRIEVIGHPDPRPLFLDPELGPAAFERLIPYSTFSSGACSKALWEKVMASNAGGVTP